VQPAIPHLTRDYDSHAQPRVHVDDLMATDNFARRLKTLGGFTPYEYIHKIWTSEPERSILDPILQMPGLNTQRNVGLSCAFPNA